MHLTLIIIMIIFMISIIATASVYYLEIKLYKNNAKKENDNLAKAGRDNFEKQVERIRKDAETIRLKNKQKADANKSLDDLD